jgi:phosphonate transport system permease protein
MGHLLTGWLAGPHSGPAPQAPPRPSALGRNLLSNLMLAVALGWAAQVIELRPLELLRDLGNIGVFLKGYLHPSLTHVKLYAWQCGITICIAFWGTVMAIAVRSAYGPM